MPTAPVVRRNAIVRGVVQGVGFRYFTREQARRVGVTGWVRNRADGSVEVEVEGTDAAVLALLAWLGDGPPSASVTAVEVTELPALGTQGFRITGV